MSHFIQENSEEEIGHGVAFLVPYTVYDSGPSMACTKRIEEKWNFVTLGKWLKLE